MLVFLVLLDVVEAEGEDFDDDVNEDLFPVRVLLFIRRFQVLILHCFVVL